MGLCQACDSLDIALLQDQRRHVHLENISDILETSKTCRMCAFVGSCVVDDGSRGERLYEVFAGFAHDDPRISSALVVQMNADSTIHFSSSEDDEDFPSVRLVICLDDGAIYRCIDE